MNNFKKHIALFRELHDLLVKHEAAITIDQEGQKTMVRYRIDGETPTYASSAEITDTNYMVIDSVSIMNLIILQVRDNMRKDNNDLKNLTYIAPKYRGKK
jgi:hypothetical protein